MRTLLLIAGCWISCVVPALGQGAARPLPPDLPETNPYSSAVDLEMGRRLYIGRCGHCHGQDGEGGRGAVLNAGRFRHGSSDRELFAIIRNGIPNTEMPPTFGVSTADVWRMVGYLRQLGRRQLSGESAAEPSTGDATAGAVVYQRSGCATCHTIDGTGGFLGPDLTGIGAKRAVRHLRESLVNPSADIPLDYRSVSVTDRAGKTISGIHLNEDEYSVHLRDAGGNLRSFMKSDLAQLTLPRQSLMPPLVSRSPRDLENLVAYLAGLQSERKSP